MTLDWQKLRNELDAEKEAEKKAKIRRQVRELKTSEGLKIISPLARLVMGGLKRPVYTRLVLADANYSKGLQFLKKGEDEKAARYLTSAVSTYAQLFKIEEAKWDKPASEEIKSVVERSGKSRFSQYQEPEEKKKQLADMQKVAKRAYRVIDFVRRYDADIADKMYSTWEKKTGVSRK